MNYLVWFGLVVIAVTDAREHRIPNVYLLITLLVCVINGFFQPDPLDVFLNSLSGGAIFFVSALLLHFIRIMAPGDVKLLGVVGFWLGWGQLLNATVWIALSSVVVGLLYALFNRVQTGSTLKQLIKKYSMMLAYGSQASLVMTNGGSIEKKLRMPFAPVVVIGLAMFHYF
ncbi:MULTISPECIES: A24 family peptidase [Vibrio]|uniref:A24 family peptidase n=1 Tax=Vibrio TaxID=662 RepID=UPI000571F168|nr:A24 family peptidase [Vibrio pacinii]